MSVDYTRRPSETIDDFIARVRAESNGRQHVDTADRALFSARADADSRRGEPISPGTKTLKPRDQLLLEAIQEQFRRNPELAEAWQKAPGKMTSN